MAASGSRRATGERFDVTDPGTGEIVGSVPNARRERRRARRSTRPRRRSTSGRRSRRSSRARILRRAADLIRERATEIALVMTSEQGKPLAEAAGEVDYAASFLEWFGGEAERVYGQVVPPMNPANRVLVLRQPVGVTAAITPVELPGRDDDAQARPGDGRGLHERRQAGERHAADRRARSCARSRTRARRPASST